jgi:hypothetical protein
MAIALADVGKSVREILYGTPKEGTFTYDQKVTYSTKTADGVVRLAVSTAASLAWVPADMHLQLWFVAMRPELHCLAAHVAYVW